MNSYVKDNVKNLKPYKADDDRPEIMLDANENPYPLDEKIIKGILSSIDLSTLNRYPDSRARELCRKLASYTGYGVSEDMIMVGDGSDELINIVISSLVKKGNKIMLCPPSFSMYNIYSTLNEGEIVEYQRESDFTIDVDGFIKAAEDVNPSAVIICNPNNPTGTLTPREDIIKLLKGLKCALIIDEAYLEFSGGSVVDLIGRYDNLIILKTLSKAWGLAGVRLGYLISNKEMVCELLKAKPPFNVNSITQYVASAALEYKDVMEKNISLIISEKERLIEKLSKFKSYVIYEGAANFILLRMPDADMMSVMLRKSGIAIRNFNGSPGLDNCIRITVGTPYEDDRLVEEITKIEGGAYGKEC